MPVALTVNESSALIVRLRSAGCVYAEDEAAILVEAATDVRDLERLAAARVAGAPLEVLVGWAAFRGLRIRIAPGVFVPRTRTEFVVETALESLSPNATVLDLCCGAGAIGAAIRSARPDVTVVAADIDRAAVDCARINLPADRVFLGDLFAALPQELVGRIDLIAVNAPYVPSAMISTMPREAREHEPLASLDGGLDGLAVHGRIAAEAASWLGTAGRIVLETSEAQAGRTARLLEAGGFAVHVRHSVRLDATVAVGDRPPASSPARP